jgi:hypothetical protein
VVRKEGVRADDALDCVQEAFLNFLNLPQARLLVGLPDDSARMLIILARNVARNRRRRHDYSRPHVVDDATIQGLASDATSADEVIAAAEQHAMILGCMVTFACVWSMRFRARMSRASSARPRPTWPFSFSEPNSICGAVWKTRKLIRCPV